MTFEAQPISGKEIMFSEYDESGCPVCNTGEKEGFVAVRQRGKTVFICANCRVAYAVIQDSSESLTGDENGI